MPTPPDELRPAANISSSDNLTDFYLLAQVIEFGGFSAAAQRTGIGKSRLSRRIIELEQRLGCQLLQRNTRKLAVTPAGAAVYQHIREMLRAAQAAESTIRQFHEEPCGLIRICASPLLEELLAEPLARFAMHHPRVRIALGQGECLRELLGQRADLALTFGEAADDGLKLVLHPLARLRLVCVGSPQLLAQLGQPQRLGELDAGRFLHLGQPHTPQRWRLRDDSAPSAAPSYLAPSLGALRSAARSGLGIAQLPLYACIDELESGTLQLALKRFEPEPCLVAAFTPPGYLVAPAVRSLLQYLREQLPPCPRRGILRPDTRSDALPA